MRKDFVLKTRFSILIGLLFGTCIQAQEVNLQKKIPLDPKIRKGKLENGITYYIRKNEKPENRLELRLALNAGSILENEDQLGLAHFTEHMAFNGTENFSKNELVKYLQSVGVRFGAHLNAYTSFDETVYMLHLPSDSAGIVNKGFQILEDWAYNLSFDTVEIDKERGVVIEEWRLGQGADRRMLDEYLPVLYKDSRYAERLPIGKKEVLETFEYETLKQFYEDWYRPELMSVIAVGDMDVDEIEKKIKKHFSRIQPVKNPKPRKKYPVPDHKETLIKVVSDEEAAFTRIMLFYKHDPREMEKQKDFRSYIRAQLYSGMFNQRLDELRQKADPPFIYANTRFGRTWARTKSAYQATAVVSETGIEKGLKAIVEEIKRVKTHGFTKGELERYKKEMLSAYEQAYNERDKTESKSYASEYVRNFLNNEPAPGITFEYNFVKKILPGISLEEVNNLTGKWIRDENKVIVVTAPKKQEVVLPEESNIRDILQEVQDSEVAPYKDKVTSAALMAKKPKAGTIIEENKLNEIGVTEWTLSNGVKVKLKPTDFKNDEVLVRAFSPGGHSVYPDDVYHSAANASAIIGQSGLKDMNQIELQKYLAGKVVSLSPFIDDLTEGLSGSAAPKDLETLFQLMHLQFVAPRKDPDVFQSFIAKNKAIYQNIMSNPQYYYYDSLARIMSQNHLRGDYFPTMKDWERVKLEEVYNVYKDRFKDAGDFTFLIVGAFDLVEIKPLVETYLGSLPMTGREESWRDQGVRPPDNKVMESVEKGGDPKSRVTIIFTDKYGYDRMESYKLNVLAEILDIKLIEVLREEKSGVYGAGASSSMTQYPYEHYSFRVAFPCSPDNVEELTQATFDIIRKLKEEGPDEKDLNKVKETLRREREENLDKNGYWLSVLNTYYFNKEDPRETLKYEERIQSITREDVKETARKYLKKDDYIQVVLYPELE